MSNTKNKFSASEQEWLQKGATDISVSKKNIDWVGKIFEAPDAHNRFIKTRKDFYLIAFVVAIAHEKQPEMWKGRKGNETFKSAIVRDWDIGTGDQARTLLRKVYGHDVLDTGMNPEVGANNCISSLVDQGIDIIKEKYDEVTKAGDYESITWFGISNLISSPILFKK